MDRLIRDLVGKRTIAQAIRELPPLAGVNAILAQRYATAVDRAVDANDDARLVAAGEKLRVVLAALEQPKPEKPEGGAGDDGGTGTRGRVTELFSGRPTLGHTADA